MEYSCESSARKIPGPAGLLYDGNGSVPSGAECQENNILSDYNTTGNLDWSSSRSWKAMSVGLVGGTEEEKDNMTDWNDLGIELVDKPSLEQLIPATVAQVQEGLYDLKVPRIVTFIGSMTATQNGDWTLLLEDKTGAISGFITMKHMGLIEARLQQSLNSGCTVLLENVSIFASNNGPIVVRHLNIVSSCVIAIWSN